MLNTVITYIDNTAIEDLIKVRREEYLRSPLRIVEDYNNENKNIDEYNGRQLLEMIQNANDESDTLKAKKVFIKLDENSLIIANNGNAFSLGGVESLMYSDLSPKTMEENKVGKKGLGFRSILNWSKEIYIASYDLHLKFSQQHAEDFLKSVLEEKSEIIETLKRKTKKKIPISVLRCPYLETDISRKKATDYDTVIELTLKEDEAIYDNIINQIEKDLVPETLIFLNKLEEIEVQTPEAHFIISKTSLPHNKVKITKIDFLDEDENAEWIWNILEEKGQIEGIEETKNYELKIAYNPNETPTSKKLFSFFRTEINFPYPVIAHGSFELKSDRNQLSEDKNGFNKLLLSKLANLLVSCSIELKKDKKCNYEALKLVIPSFANNSSLNNYPWNFDIAIEKAIANTSIFPSINNKYLKLSENIKFYNLPIQNSLPKKAYPLFQSLLQETTDKDVIDYLSNLGVNLKYSDSEFTEKINQILDKKYFSEKQRVDWIYFVCEKTRQIYNSEKPIVPFLLMNAESEQIDSFDTVIVPPKEVTYKLPKGIKLQYLNQDLFRRIRSKFIGMSSRQVIDKLDLYNVAEYALNVVAQKIISSTHANIKDGRKNKAKAIAEMHKALYSIFSNLEENSDAKNNFPSGLTSPLLFTRKNELKEAKKLYFGNDYSVGYLMEDLLKEVKEDVFVGSLDVNRFFEISQVENHSLERYLKWLGVADFPKKEFKEIKAHSFNDNEFFKIIINSIKYPFTTLGQNEKINNIEEMETCWDFECTVLWYEHFEDIIKGASFEYLLTWFIKDIDLNSSLVSNQEFRTSEFRFEYPKKQYSRRLPKQEIKSYILYILQQTAFIPVEDGEKSRPEHCLLDSNNLSPLVKTPRINYSATSFIDNNIDEEQLNYFLKRIGLKDSLKDLTIKSLYKLLNQHNTHFLKAPSNIQSFYSAIIEATKNRDVIENNIERKEYFETGHIYAFFEGKNDFFPLNEVTYVDNPNFSQDLLKKLKIAKLPPRSGNARMQNLFGLQPLDYIKFDVQEKVKSNTKLNEAFVGELNEIKPHLYAFRFQKGLKKSQLKLELSAIKNIKITTAYSIDVKYTMNKVDYNLSLNKYEYIQDETTKVYYIKLDPENTDYHELKKDFRFKETIADIIGGALKVAENRKDFILLLGESSSNWFHIMEREFENYEILEKEIIGKFDGVLSSEQRFWKLILDLKKATINSEAELNSDSIHNRLFKKIPKDEFFNTYRMLNYNNLSERNNFDHIQKIFWLLKIDLDDFNSLGYKIINFESHLENQLYTFHKNFSDKFASYLFKKKQSSDFIQTWERISKFDTFSVNNSINFDIRLAHRAAIQSGFPALIYETITETDKVDLDTIYKNNITSLESELRRAPNFNDSVFNDIRYENSFRNAVYFDEIKGLKKDLLKKFNILNKDKNISKINIGPSLVNFSENNFNAVLTAIEEQVKNNDFKIEYYDSSKASVTSRDGDGNHTTRQSTNGKSKEHKNEDIGFIGEKFAFELLKKEFDNVQWVSEYAIKAGLPSGRDGLGYDFECRNGDETRFVEVKSSITKNYSFNISTNEVRIGHSNEKSFDILLITNLLSDEINFKYLKNIFDYSDNENFLENTKFLVENDSYKIKFK